MIRAAVLSLILWPLYVLVWVPILIAGVPVVYVLARRQAWHERPSKYFPVDVIVWRHAWAAPWQNWTDGVIGPQWYRDKHPDRSDSSSAFHWSALRNPANGFRYIPILHPVIDPKRIYFVGNSNDPTENVDDDGIVKRFQWALTWQSVYAGFVFRWQITKTHHFLIRVGWKLLPRDRFGVPATDYRSVRCPFGIQLHVWRRSKVS